MRKLCALASAVALFMAIGIVPATADGADVLRWSGTYSGPNSWGNPCTGEEVVLLSEVEVGGVVVRDPTGEVHIWGYSNLISGEEYERFGLDVFGDPTGWVMIDYRVNTVRGGTLDPETGAALFTWQMRVTVENPETGERYISLLNNHYVVSATGELVVDAGQWGISPHNTCLGIPAN